MNASAAGDTFVCRMTPAGRGAISTILVDGPRALDCVARCFQPLGSARFTDAAVGRVMLGCWSPMRQTRSHPEQGHAEANEAHEETVVCRTGVDQVEVHCHGGTVAWRWIVESLEELGCRSVDWPELAESDPLRRDALIALSQANTARVAAILMDQWRGALGSALAELDRALASSDRDGSMQRLMELLRYQGLGSHLTRPWKVVLAGAPNVGKSSLINALVGFQRALVYPLPGTTRDVVSVTTVIDGWPVEFSDTAGLRATDEPIEAAGVQKTVEQLAQCDLVVFVLDASREMTTAEQHWLSRLSGALRVANKVDLPTATRPPVDAIPTSALNGQGISELLAQIIQQLVDDVPAPNTPVPFTADHFLRLQQVRDAVEEFEFLRARRCLQSLWQANA